jgi:transcriptional regulator with XRE-family HTH domain
MAVNPADVRAIVERVCARPEVLDACARRDLGTVIEALTDKRTGGLSQSQLAEFIPGVSQGRLSEWKTGKRKPEDLSTFQNFADGLGMPSAARRALGLDSKGLSSVPAPRAAAELDVSYPDSPAKAIQNVSHLWLTDLGDPAALQRGRADHRAWNDASLRWLTDPGGMPEESARGVQIGLSDIARFRTTVDMFAKLDDRFGGGHARQALIQYLAIDADRILNGRYSEPVGRVLFTAVSEATLLAAWMAYDSAPASALAQVYFVQALALAQAGGDRLLGAGILDAMSHQATFAGRYTEAETLARAAREGTRGMATTTLTAHFHAMEARALARLRDTKACGHALAETMREFERADPGNDPPWFQYFNESELSAELGHCMRDLGRPGDAVQHAGNALGVTEEFARSDFFVSLVLADAHLAAGDIDQACAVVLHALTAGEPIRSARCVSYLREFIAHLPPTGHGLAGFREQAAQFRLWRIASRPEKPVAS